jgi:hypothetical protein
LPGRFPAFAAVHTLALPEQAVMRPLDLRTMHMARLWIAERARFVPNLKCKVLNKNHECSTKVLLAQS